jgi:flavodoxin
MAVMSAKELHAIYASTSGNVETAVEYVANLWQAAGHTVHLHRAEQTKPEVLTANQHFLLATSTWEHGVINPFFQPLLDVLKTTSLTQQRAAFLGLGDTRYEPVLFCGGMEVLKQGWERAGGKVVGTPLKVNGEPYHQLDNLIKPWAEQIWPLWGMTG